MSRYALFDRQAVSLLPLAERGHDLTIDRVWPLGPPATPLDHNDFPALLAAIRQARRDQRPVIVLLGGHPIKLGLSRYLIDLMERGWITHLATNGAGIIHDFELALVGGTSENVAKWIPQGQFGLWQETSRLNAIIQAGARRGEGLGEAVGMSGRTYDFFRPVFFGAFSAASANSTSRAWVLVGFPSDSARASMAARCSFDMRILRSASNPDSTNRGRGISQAFSFVATYGLTS